MRAVIFALIFAAWSAPECDAGLIYTFTYTESPNLNFTRIESFSFSFPSATFITDGILPLTPFDVTDGVNTWTLTHGVAQQVSGIVGCFMFAGDDATIIPDCGDVVIGTTGPPNAAGIYFSLFPSLPTAPGAYDGVVFDGTFAPNESIFGRQGGEGNDFLLTITAVPEPSPVVLMVATLGFMSGTRLRWKRRLSRSGGG